MVSKLVRAYPNLLRFLLLDSRLFCSRWNKILDLLGLIRVFSEPMLRFGMEFAGTRFVTKVLLYGMFLKWELHICETIVKI